MAIVDGRRARQRAEAGQVWAGGPVLRWRRRYVGSQLVTLREVRLWMAAVPHWPGPENSDRWWRWVESYSVAAKVARELAAGTFYRTVLAGLLRHGMADRRTLRLVKRAAGDWR